jgi:transcription antitermination factor NusA-like protein
MYIVLTAAASMCLSTPQMQENLFEVQGEVASGQRIEFTVPIDLLGLIIGKKGSRIQEVEEETGVTDVHIDGETGWEVLGATVYN